MRPNGSKGAGLFAYLRGLQSESGKARQDVIANVFKGVSNRMESGYLLRDVINKVSGIHFTASERSTLSAAFTKTCCARCVTRREIAVSSTPRARS